MEAMLVIRVAGVREPYLFPGLGNDNFMVDGGVLFVTGKLQESKTVIGRDGKEVVIDSVCLAAFGTHTLEACLVAPDPEAQPGQQPGNGEGKILPALRMPNFSRPGRRG